MANSEGSERLIPEDPDRCPKCGGETTFSYGLAGGGVEDEEGNTVPGVYFLCLEEGCDWMGPQAQKTICFPHGSGPSGKHRTGCAVYLHCKPEQRGLWRAAAAADGRDLSSWLRVVADRAARSKSRSA